ncbi:preprotein translocase subunit SecG [Christensenellaceae bacterium OttesenSCG-928-K19]|nr:preprotein translocase subunit SecG [Christensenellaceae bacterium OttesenSCG-928-K19]
MEAMDVLSLIIKIVLVVFSVFLIAVVLLQSGQRAGVSGAIGGGAEQLFGKKKARGLDALLVRLTKIAAIGFMVLAVLLVVIQKYWM